MFLLILNMPAKHAWSSNIKRWSHLCFVGLPQIFFFFKAEGLTFIPKPQAMRLQVYISYCICILWEYPTWSTTDGLILAKTQNLQMLQYWYVDTQGHTFITEGQRLLILVLLYRRKIANRGRLAAILLFFNNKNDCMRNSCWINYLLFLYGYCITNFT